MINVFVYRYLQKTILINKEIIMGNEKRKSGFFEMTRKNHKMKIVTCVVLSSIIIALYFILDSIVPIKVNYIISNDMNLINQIEKVSIEDNIINISGYAFILDMNSDDTKISILLRGVNEGKEIWTDVKQTFRADVNSYFNSDNKYENTGFYASIEEKKLDIDECYEIIVKLKYVTSTANTDMQNTGNNASKTVSANRYIMNGELYSYNPYKLDQSDMKTTSKLLREVFTSGQLCFYQKNVGMYVYQYDGRLYWVANKEFVFAEDRKTRIPYYAYTSQTDKIPENSIQYGFDYLDFYFEEYEYNGENTAPYRIAIRDIPDTYPISYIITGVYDTVNSEWLWKKQFQLNHDFE